jgi:cysteinyl-tRNA synthetase
VLDADRVLGLGLGTAAEPEATPTPESAEIDALLAERSAARASRDFARADELRDQLRERGAEPIDHPDGSSSTRPLR